MLARKFIDMTEADKIGLVNKVVPQTEHMNEIMKFAGKIASKCQLAVRAISEAVKEGVNVPIEDGLALKRRQLGNLV
jgi:enoyl-CoA hydratase/carnithine racemase